MAAPRLTDPDVDRPRGPDTPRPVARRGLLGAALALPALLAGCYVVPIGAPHGRGPGGGRGGGHDDGGAWVQVPPPAPRYEPIPVAPGPGYLWIGGYWSWQVNRHVWIGGRWALPPAGHVWVPHRWDRGRRGWSERPGHWGRR